MDTYLDPGPFPDFHSLLFDLLFGFFHDFLDTGRVDTAVGYQSLQGKAGDLAAQRVKRRQYNGFRSIVYDKVHSRSRFNSTDITTLTANDLALYLVAFQVEYSNRVLDGLFCSGPLNALDNDLPGFFIGPLFGVVNNFLLQRQGSRLGFLLQAPDQ